MRLTDNEAFIRERIFIIGSESISRDSYEYLLINVKGTGQSFFPLHFLTAQISMKFGTPVENIQD